MRHDDKQQCSYFFFPSYLPHAGGLDGHWRVVQETQVHLRLPTPSQPLPNRQVTVGQHLQGHRPAPRRALLGRLPRKVQRAARAAEVLAGVRPTEHAVFTGNGKEREQGRWAACPRAQRAQGGAAGHRDLLGALSAQDPTHRRRASQGQAAGAVRQLPAVQGGRGLQGVVAVGQADGRVGERVGAGGGGGRAVGRGFSWRQGDGLPSSKGATEHQSGAGCLPASHSNGRVPGGVLCMRR